jgi:hypothetical protein
VVSVAEWLDGSFESQSRFEKLNSGSILESPKILLLYNNTPSNAIVNAVSDITYRPVINADDTAR